MLRRRNWLGHVRDRAGTRLVSSRGVDLGRLETLSIKIFAEVVQTYFVPAGELFAFRFKVVWSFPLFSSQVSLTTILSC